MPFGRGIHGRIRSPFATAQMTVMLARLLARPRLTLPDQRIPAAGYAVLPRNGLTARVEELA